MYLTLTSTAEPATDLGYLLHKHPERAQRFDLSVGTAHVFYPEATDTRCTVALLLEVDPVGLVRGKRVEDSFGLGQYISDRPYAASSLLAVALGRVFGSALTGRCDARPQLVDIPLPLEVHVPALPGDGDPGLIERLFAPLGWQVTAVPQPLDAQIPAWGNSRYCDVRLRGTVTVRAALSHLYVLLPVLDGAKHYWVGSDEVDKLVRAGGSWLAGHPGQDLITRRYLAHQRAYVADATARLQEREGRPDDSEDAEEPAAPPSPGLAEQRRQRVLAVLRDAGARRVVDLGCGEGALLADLVADLRFDEIVGLDVSPRALERAARRLGLDRLAERQRKRVTLRQSSVTYRDARLTGYDAVVLMEVIEHVDPARLPDLERVVFAAARPALVVLTTPNADANPRFRGLSDGQFRHPDHRFEWTRAELAGWADAVAARHGYAVDLGGVGEEDAQVGAPTSLAVFRRTDPAEAGR